MINKIKCVFYILVFCLVLSSNVYATESTVITEEPVSTEESPEHEPLVRTAYE